MNVCAQPFKRDHLRGVNLMSQQKSREYPSGQYGQEEIAVRYQTSLYTGVIVKTVPPQNVPPDILH